MTCPACHSNPVPAGKVLCRRCWSAVPINQRMDVNAARRAYRGLQVDHDPTDRLLRLNEYEAAKDAAIRAAIAALTQGVTA